MQVTSFSRDHRIAHASGRTLSASKVEHAHRARKVLGAGGLVQAVCNVIYVCGMVHSGTSH